MKYLRFAALLTLIAIVPATDVLAKGKQAPAQRQPDLCVTPAGAQPLLPAQMLPGMGTTKRFAETTTSDDARKFFLHGISQTHSFWLLESARSCTQPLPTGPEI